MRIAVRIDAKGPLFDGEPGDVLLQNARRMVADISERGEQDIRRDFPVGGAGDAHPGLGRTGIIGRTESLAGTRWKLHGVISQQHTYPWGGHLSQKGRLMRTTGRRQGGTVRSGKGTKPNTSQAQYRGGKLEAKLHLFGNETRRLNALGADGHDLTAGLE